MITLEAQLALKAVKGFYSWGAYAYQRYVAKHHINRKLLSLAHTLEHESRMAT